MTVENRTGAAIHLLEVDYPSAGFGADSLAPGELFHYQVQLRGSAPLKVQYTGSAGQQVQIEGPRWPSPRRARSRLSCFPAPKRSFIPN